MCETVTVCARTGFGGKVISFDSISSHCIPWRYQWEVCVAVATVASHPLSGVGLLMVFSSSQTITRDTRTDEGNMSSFSCQEGLRGQLMFKRPAPPSEWMITSVPSELWEFVTGGQPSRRDTSGALC